MQNEIQPETKAPVNSSEYRMANDNLKSLVMRYSLPTIIGMLVNALYNVVDRFWVGKIEGEVGLYGLGGIGLCMSIMTMVFAVGQLTGMGAAANISMSLGQGDRDRAERILGNTLTLSSAISFSVVVVMFIFRRGILNIVGADDNTFPYALEYITIILAGGIFNMVTFSLNHCIRATGNPKRFASTQILGALINIVLDPILIFNFNMGVAGAAYATIIAQFASAVWVTSYFFTKNAAIRFRLKNLKVKVSEAVSIISIGVAPFLMQVMGSFIIVIANNSLKFYGARDLSSATVEESLAGSVAVSAFTVINSISTLFVMPVIGINQGSQPIIGYNYGARNFERTREALKWAIIYSVAICGAGFVIVQLFAPQLVRFFNEDTMLIETGAVGIRMFLFALPFVGFQIIASTFFQSIGHARMSILLTLLRQAILLAPLYLILPRFFGLTGIWAAAPVSDVCAAAITFFALRREFKRLGIDT
ncbi:MAG: MATE family efflux transporter [Clostridiales bacterium]|jgi:putative MATE family efflux protein|nr:MATE family efflux transporter [Clostridiales bacterium]